MFINLYIARPTYRFILIYTCGLTAVIKRICYVMLRINALLTGQYSNICRLSCGACLVSGLDAMAAEVADIIVIIVSTWLDIGDAITCVNFWQHFVKGFVLSVSVTLCPYTIRRQRLYSLQLSGTLWPRSLSVTLHVNYVRLQRHRTSSTICRETISPPTSEKARRVDDHAQLGDNQASQS